MPPSELDTGERIVRLETKLDFIIQTMDRLPPSPTCIQRHIEYEARLGALETLRNKAIGAVLILNVVIVFFMEKIRAVFLGQ